jgi:hypothetical protein
MLDKTWLDDGAGGYGPFSGWIDSCYLPVSLTAKTRKKAETTVFHWLQQAVVFPVTELTLFL